MGLLVDGQWQDKWYDTNSSGGAFKRQESQFRNWITKDGQAGPSGVSGFKAQKDRYHLYVSLACPWAHRTLIFRQLKNLNDVISVSVVNPIMREQGWTFAPYNNDETTDELYSFDFLHQIYTKVDSHITSRVTVPILWDKQNQTIVSNESSKIIRMFNSAFNDITGNTEDYYPESLQTEIDSINELVSITVCTKQGLPLSNRFMKKK